MIRKAAFAGPMRFYAGTRERLTEQIERYVMPDAAKETALGVISPHAGYDYSGPVAGELWSKIEAPETTVILAPNHHGMGEPFALWPSGSWETPLGEVRVDQELTDAIADQCPLVSRDPSAHYGEHAVEVQVPFLQYFRNDAKLVAMVLSEHRLEPLQQLGEALARVIAEAGRDVLVVASSDMSHFETQSTANELDHMALDQVLALDEAGLWRVVRDGRISMCGVSPSISMLACAKKLGATEATLVRYQTSGDVTGDMSRVVGYAGVTVR